MPSNVLLVVEILAVVGYALSTVTFTVKKIPEISGFFWIAAIVLNAAIVVNNWMLNGYVPFVSMYQVLTFLALTFAPLYLLVKTRYGGSWMRGCFSGAAMICMIGVCFMSGKGEWSFPPSLQSMFFVPHILCYMISYSLITVSCMLTVYSFLVKKDAKRIENGIYNLAVTSFPFMTMGMLFGAVWANEVWGAFWSFDAKESWSLVTWLMICLYLHVRRDEKLKKYSKAFILLGFVCVVITMLFVNMMGGSSMHTYSAG